VLALDVSLHTPAVGCFISPNQLTFICYRCQVQARGMIIQRAEAIGLDWDGTLKQLQQQDWETRLQNATDPAVDSYPSYFTQPFHAYKQVGATAAQHCTAAAALPVNCAAASLW
jgi:hypothetical protein